jgi:drug/metabolite transporter (DMT)-like permease
VTYMLLAAVIVSISLGQVAQKLAARTLDLRAGYLGAVSLLMRSGWLWTAIALLALGLLLWFAVLSVMDVKTAYPALALSFVVTTLLSAVLLGERVGLRSWLGVLLITVGVFSLLAR